MSNDPIVVVNGVLGGMFLSLYDQPQKRNENIILIEKQIASGVNSSI